MIPAACSRIVSGSVRAAALAALTIGLAGPAGAQVSPQGGELQVNTYTTGMQSRPALASDGDGAFVVVWDSLGSGGGDTSSYSVQARRFDAHGQAPADDFQVNTLTTDYQMLPAVAFGAQGDFVVVWQSFASGGGDTSGQSIQVRRYDSGGLPQGAELQVNSQTQLDQAKPAIARAGQGGFVAVWESVTSAGTDTAWSIQMRPLDAAGVPLPGEAQVNTYTTGIQSRPAVAADSLGGFVVVWQSAGSNGTDTDSYSVHAQRFDANGGALGAEIQVNTYTSLAQRRPAVAVTPAGDFVVAWESGGSSGNDTSSYSIQARRFEADGTPLGVEFQVNSYTLNSQAYPAVAATPAGDFVVAWRSMGSVGNDAVTYSIQARRFDAAGDPLSAQFQVNTYTTAAQQWPAVAADGLGNFLVGWQSGGSSGTDHSSYSIQAQRYDALYRDGFETGDLSRWSSAVP